MGATWWQRVAAALGGEFDDLADAGELTRVVVRLALAAALGGLLGYGRERAGKAAGMRTHMLVAIGAALFVLLPERIGMGEGGESRVMQGLIAGIGFLGAGAIVKRKEVGEVEGLTTAAGIWATSAIGTAAGLGRGATAVLGAVLAAIILAVLPAHQTPGRHGP